MKKILLSFAVVVCFFSFLYVKLYSQQTNLPTIEVDGILLQVHPRDHDSQLPWGPENNISDAVSLSDGKTNTQKIVQKYGDWNNGNYAANICAQLSSGGFNDWYLPSRKELQKIYENREQIENFKPAYYWSSTDDTWGAEAQVIDFSSGYVLFQSKGNPAHIRCVRHKIEPSQADIPATQPKQPEAEPVASRHQNVSTPVPDNNTFTDPRDGKTYKTVQIGNQVWMAENLAFRMNAGCLAYDNDENNVTKFGYLYNWETAKNSACPPGWRLFGYSEFEVLKNIAVSRFKATRHWYVNDEDEIRFAFGGFLGFVEQYGGMARIQHGNEFPQSFGVENINSYSYYWTSTETYGRSSDAVLICNSHGYIVNMPKIDYASVRCIKSDEPSFASTTSSNLERIVSSSQNQVIIDQTAEIANNKYGWEIKVVRADNGLPIPNATVVVDYGTVLGYPQIYYTDGNGIAMVKEDQRRGSNPLVTVERVAAQGYKTIDFYEMNDRWNMSKSIDVNDPIAHWTFALHPENPSPSSSVVQYPQTGTSRQSNSQQQSGKKLYGWEVRVIRADNGLPIPNATVLLDWGNILGTPKLYYTDGTGIAMVKLDYLPGSEPLVIVERVTAQGYKPHISDDLPDRWSMSKRISFDDPVAYFTITLWPL